MLKAQYKLAIGLSPFLASAIFLSTTLYPAYLDDQQKRSDLAAKKLDNNLLLAKLGAKGQAEAERRSLENQISTLRGSVPKSPELDLFMLDLEKMCAESGVDLISVETPEPETMHNLETSEQEVHRILEESNSHGKLIGSKSLEAKKPVVTQQPQVESEDQTALKKLVKQVYVTSDYDGIIKLMRKLEHYERVTGVKQVNIALGGDTNEGTHSVAADKGKRLGLEQPVMSFLMTLYYLP